MRARELTLALAAAFGCTAAAQYEPDTLKPLPPVCDVFVMPGGQAESMFAVGIEQWRKLAPGSELLKADLSDHDSNGRIGDGRGPAQAMGLSMSVALRLGGENRVKRSGAYLRAGFTYQHHEGTDLLLRKQTRTPYDSLTSSQTGQVTYVDSLTISRYDLSHTYSDVALDASLVFMKEYPKRWSLYGGAGLQLGMSFSGRVQVTHTMEHRTDPSLVSGTGPQDRDMEATHEEFTTEGDLCLGLYVPLGVSYRLGKKSAFWRALNLSYELRPSLNFGGVPEVAAGARAGLGQFFGLRVDLVK